MAWAKPTNVELLNNKGVYSGTSAKVYGNNDYYVYVGGPWSNYKYYYKGRIVNGNCVINIDADTDYTSGYKEFQIILNNVKVLDGKTLSNYVTYNYVYSFSCPAIVCYIYSGSSIGRIYDSYNDSDLSSVLHKTGWGLDGLSSSQTETYSTYNASWGPLLDGKTLYAVYSKDAETSSATRYYYRGTSSGYTVTITTTTSAQKLYGTGQTSGGTTSTSMSPMTTSCAADSSYSLVGWAISSDSTSAQYNDAEDAFNNGYTTIYGVYLKEGSSSNLTCYYYRGSSTRNSVAKTVSVSDAYYYGAGSHRGGDATYSYGSVDSSCAVSGWTFLGWTNSSNTQQGSSSSAADLFDAGNTTIYGTYSKTESMTCYPQNGNSSSSASTTNYRYGTGSVTANRPTEPSLVYEDHTFQGWGVSSTDKTPETWVDLWDSGTRTVYAIWKEDYVYNVYYGVNGVWKPCKLYSGVTGEWKLSEAKIGVGGAWKQ